jgi:hypothetical protein
MYLVLTCLRCSRVSVREVFEVMVQVDHDLTTVNCFDQQLELIKNLGRHMYSSLFTVVQKGTMVRSTTMTLRSSEAYDPPVKCLWERKT